MEDSAKNIFHSPNPTAIVMFTGEDVSPKGFVQSVETRYHVVDILQAQSKRVGQVGVAKSGQRVILAMVNKHGNQVASAQATVRGLQSLKKACTILKLKTIALPRLRERTIGMKWLEFKRHVRQTFYDTDISVSIHIKRYERQSYNTSHTRNEYLKEKNTIQHNVDNIRQLISFEATHSNKKMLTTNYQMAANTHSPPLTEYSTNLELNETSVNDTSRFYQQPTTSTNIKVIILKYYHHSFFVNLYKNFDLYNFFCHLNYLFSYKEFFIYILLHNIIIFQYNMRGAQSFHYYFFLFSNA
jgi:hypothetical protein